jgi:hypothetical protein
MLYNDLTSTNSDLSDLSATIPYFNTNDIIVITSDWSNPVRAWTATKDCIVCVRIATNLSTSNVVIYVDNVEVYYQYNSSSSTDIMIWQRIPLKKGQRISMNTTDAGSFLLKAIGVGV